MAIGAALAAALVGAPAQAHVRHTVVPGESLWSVSAANGLTPGAVAAANDLPADAWLTAGSEIVVPTPGAGTTATANPAGGPPPLTPPSWVIPIHHPSATPYLAAEAATAWEAMRQESLRIFGVDLYPLGPASGYRSWEQQAYFWELYQSGAGNPASPPGTSSHETGNSIDVATLQMRDVIDRIGAQFGWQKVEAPTEWWHVTYVGGYGG